MSGFFNLIHHSKQKLAEEIKDWLDEEVLPALAKHGSYSIQSKKLEIKCFYDDVTISSFYGKFVVYIGYIGKINGEHVFKYGLSKNMFKRDYEQHSKNFKKFEVVFIGETENCDKVEMLFGQDLKVRKLHRTYKELGTEFFTVSTIHPIENLIDNMKQLIINNPLLSLKEAKDQLALVESKCKGYKQSEELRKLELQFRMSDNYKLELEKDVEVRKLEAERKLVREKLKLALVMQGRHDEIEVKETSLKISKKQTRKKNRNITKI